MKALTLLFPAILLGISCLAQRPQKPLAAISPDKRTAIIVQQENELRITINHDGKILADINRAGLEIREQPGAFHHPVFKTATYTPHDITIIPEVPEKRSRIRDHYEETEIWFKGGYGIKLRAYNDGVAFRYMTRFDGPVTIVSEILDLRMNPFDSVFFGEETSFISHSEKQYPCISVNNINENQMCILPLVFRKQDRTLLAFTEADLLDYPGLYLSGKGKGTASFGAVLPKVAADRYISEDHRSYLVGKRYDYIAGTNGTREYPWRVFGIADTDAGLLENDLVYRLGSPCKLQETNWIKPGKVAWDWWNDWNITGVPFKAGINTETYKHYIDFASKYGLEYVIIDEGWSANDDLEKINPDMDMPALFEYAGKKNVRLILWVTGKALEDKFESSLDKFQQWGVAGIKVDFLIRDDQEMVNFYEKVAVSAAKRHMLVDFHGSFKPTGFSRTYPNALTREGVMGSENNKWSKHITPAHDCTIPFTRMFAGPMDYTPGAMTNATEKNFAVSWSQPMSMGTRCHELAKYVIFESPLQMLCDAPTNYLDEKVCMNFLSKVPTTWDETRALQAEVAHYILVARRHEQTWYLGAMTDWSSRDLECRLDFLSPGTYAIEYWKDGPNASRKGEDFQVNSEEVTPASTLKIHMAPGGGYVAKITRKE